MSVIRRAMMYGRKRSSDVNIKRGIVTLSESAAYIDITHNLNAENYIFLFRRQTAIIRQNVCNGAFMLGKTIPPFYSSSGGAVATNTIESRTDRDYSIGAMAGGAEQIANNFLPNSVRVFCRNASYPFVAGVYEWVAIDLDSKADVQGTVTLSANAATYEVTDNLNTIDKIAIMTKDVPSLNVQGWNTSHVTSTFFADALNSASLQYISGLEARPAYTDYTSVLSAASSNNNTVNTTVFKTRISVYPLLAGDYHYKIFKI